LFPATLVFHIYTVSVEDKQFYQNIIAFIEESRLENVQ